MQKPSNATKRFIEDFVKTVMNWAPRALSDYEKRALAYALFTILRYDEISQHNPQFTEDKDIDKNRFEFHMTDYHISGGLNINQFFDLAEAVSEYLKLEYSIFDEIIDVKTDPTFAIFME